MSVYTLINQQQLEHLLTQYSLGVLDSFEGIQAGIQNTNYAVNTTQGDYILTVFESLSPPDLSCYFDFQLHLCNNAFPAPKPQLNKKDQFLIFIQGKPAAFFNRLPGSSTDTSTLEQCGEVGEYLAKLHVGSKEYNLPVRSSKNLAACQSIFERIKPYLNINEISLLESELTFQTTYPLPNIPKGIIHADLFKDNVLFDKGHISGIIDFYNACEDYYLFDIAVTCNDWCIKNGSFNQQKFNAFKAGYEKFRILNEDENIHFQVFLRRAALRFWLSRLDHKINPTKGTLTLKKDPVVFQHILENHRHIIRQS